MGFVIGIPEVGAKGIFKGSSKVLPEGRTEGASEENLSSQSQSQSQGVKIFISYALNTASFSISNALQAGSF